MEEPEFAEMRRFGSVRFSVEPEDRCYLLTETSAPLSLGRDLLTTFTEPSLPSGHLLILNTELLEFQTSASVFTFY